MEFKEIESYDAHSEGLALFNLPPTNTAVQSIDWIDYRPVSNLTPSSVLEFNIPGTSTHYIDLKNTRLHIKLQLVDKDGEKISETVKACLINLPSQTSWSQVDVTLQQQTIKTVGTNHAYKALIDVLLNTTDSEKTCLLQGEGYYKDDAFQKL